MKENTIKSQWELKQVRLNYLKRGKARAIKSLMVFIYASDWLGEWHEFC